MIELTEAQQERWGRVLSGQERVEHWRPEYPRPVKKVYESTSTNTSLSKEQARLRLIEARNR